MNRCDCAHRRMHHCSGCGWQWSSIVVHRRWRCGHIHRCARQRIGWRGWVRDHGMEGWRGGMLHVHHQGLELCRCFKINLKRQVCGPCPLQSPWAQAADADANTQRDDHKGAKRSQGHRPHGPAGLDIRRVGRSTTKNFHKLHSSLAIQERT